eukprot:GILI01019585.1.p1 GENE.GILI01019585.1~~GILI01019585.1.p1  ORF type:complete len:282 (+),score=36.09 GILI01019585.1:60-905(+)
MEDDIPFPMGSLTDDQTDAAEEYQIPVEELIPNSVRHGLDPQTLSKPLDPAVYGYDINQMRERPWAKPGADKSDYFNYGFEEESWRAYCALQAQGIQSLRARADKFIAEILSSNGAAQSSASPVGGFQSTYGAQAADRSKFYKTQLCNSYLAGSCPKGLSCNFAHGQAELRQFVYSGDRPMAPAAAPMPPAVPIPTGLPPLASMPPLMPTLMPPQMPRPTGEGVLSAPAMPYVPMQTPIMSAPVMPPQPQPLSVAALPKGPAGFRMVPAQKRDRSPDNMTY